MDVQISKFVLERPEDSFLSRIKIQGAVGLKTQVGQMLVFHDAPLGPAVEAVLPYILLKFEL
jgi:hypothetical protein